MPRRPRRGLGGYTLHVMNRGARRGDIFTSPEDFQAFEEVLREAMEQSAVDLYEYCVMRNHFHMLLRPPLESDLMSFMHWLGTTHALRWRKVHRTVGEGAVYQGRYKAVAVQTATHFLTVCRYVALNPVRAGLVGEAERWRWSSAWRRYSGADDIRLTPWPVPRPPEWLKFLNTPLEGPVLNSIRQCVNRGCPIGNAAWQIETAKTLGILHTLRPPGRPKVTGVADRKK